MNERNNNEYTASFGRSNPDVAAGVRDCKINTVQLQFEALGVIHTFAAYYI
jgi:hypothetical protein